MAASGRTLLLAFLSALALMGTAQSAPTVTLEDVVKQQCGITNVATIKQALLDNVLSKCGPTQSDAKPGICDACGCAGEAMLAVLAPGIIKEKKVGGWGKLSENCRLSLSLYSLLKAGLSFDRANYIADKCSVKSNKGLWNVATLETC